MSFFAAEIISAVKLGSIYSLIAIGYSIVYSIMGLINFAHGELLMIATYALWCLLAAGVPFAPAVLIAIAITVLFGLAMERIAYRPLRDYGEETLVITSLAVSVFLQSVCQSIFGPSNKSLVLPEFFSRIHHIGSVNISNMNVIIFVSTILLITAVGLTLRYSRLGIAMRACADNAKAADLMGIDRNRVTVFAFIIGSTLAALAGIMYTGEYVSFSPTMGFMLGVKAFIAAVIGGLGSFSGAAVGGFLLGFLEILFAGYLPEGISSYQTGIVFLVLILLLLVRPSGLFGTNVERS
ncbi:MAG: branched-chain amino acid ABC transporter permease [Firmicutes bacterium]|nr:branched-chain amino acid ABC transporter permease [Bacillota bacterium]